MSQELKVVKKENDEIILIDALSIEAVKRQVHIIQDVMKSVMSEGEHYGRIPGCGPKATLLKAGAEKLAHTFRFAPDYIDLAVSEQPDFLSYRIKCKLTHIPSEKFVGSGVGACNSREKKYCKSSPWDLQNTLYKMACKRALVAAVLNATAASDIFTQDLEDLDKPVNQNKIQDRLISNTGRSIAAAEISVKQNNPTNNEKLDPSIYCPFGKNVGVEWASMSPNQLEWYWRDYESRLKDNSLEQYHPEYLLAMDGIETVQTTKEKTNE